MLIGFGTVIPGVIVHLDYAATIPPKREKRRISLSLTPSQTSGTMQRSQNKTIWADKKKSRPSIIKSVIQNFKTTSIGAQDADNS